MKNHHKLFSARGTVVGFAYVGKCGVGGRKIGHSSAESYIMGPGTNVARAEPWPHRYCAAPAGRAAAPALRNWYKTKDPTLNRF